MRQIYAVIYGYYISILTDFFCDDSIFIVFVYRIHFYLSENNNNKKIKCVKKTGRLYYVVIIYT